MAVYTDVSPEALSGFLTQYDLGGVVSLTGIAEGVENSNFHLITERGRFILTLYERRVAAADLPWFLGLMRHLAAHGIACPQPVPGRDGEALRSLASRPAAITTFLSGRDLPASDAACAQVGAVLARLHLAGEGFAAVRPNSLGPEAWGVLARRCAEAPDPLAGALGPEIADALAALETVWPRDLPSGQIHGDLFPDNVFWIDGQVSGLIDFYFACTDMLAYDLAICLNAWTMDDAGVLDPARAASLVAGYEMIRPLTPRERGALDVLGAGAALRFLLTRLHDWIHTPPDALVTRKDPIAYLNRLRTWRAHPVRAALEG